MTNDKMQAVVIHKYKKAQQAKIETVERPKIEDNQVLVKVHAASLNPVDYKIAQGGAIRMFFNYKTPYIMGHDFAGEVVAVGKHVVAFQIGDAVYGTKPGAFAEYTAATQNEIAAMPRNLSYAHAAALPMAGLTAYQALNDTMHVTRGQNVLIQAGSGGVGTLAVQIAKVLGAHVATTTSAKNRELVKALGADIVIDYHRQNFTEILKDYDGVLDTLGGTHLLDAFKIIKPLGKVVSINGKPDGENAIQFGMPLWKRWLLQWAARKIHRTARDHHAAYHFLFMHNSRKTLNKLRQLVESGKIRPVIDVTFDFEEINHALDYLKQGHAAGKVVIRISR